MKEGKVFILKDDDGNYISGNSIRFDKKNKQYYYVYSVRLGGGFYTYNDEVQAQQEIDKLIELTKEIGFEKEFHIEYINRYKVLLAEKELPKIAYPFIRLEIREGKATSVA